MLLVYTSLVYIGCAAGRPQGSHAPGDGHIPRETLRTREVIDENNLENAYDYVIAGGGLAGLVLAARLSESNTVLVLEAGLSGDDVADRINTPSGAYYSSIVGTDYDWKYVTVPQPNLNNRVISWPRGKILGGSSAMNAMYLVRPAEEELNAWQQLITSDDADAATNWGWAQMYAAMKKSENFTEPRADVAQVGNIQWDASTHGSGGPMSVSYPGIMMAIVGNWTSSLNTIGVPPLPNPNGGKTFGGFVTPSSINPTNWTRSYSRSAYIDSLPPRPSNLHILPQATVTRLLFLSDASADGWIANQVEFAQDSSSTRRTVKVRREVILAGGPIGSPAILMHSGFGPRDTLENAGIQMIEELPGVGQHLQDHLAAGVVWQSNIETAGDIHASHSDFAQSPEFLSFINDAIAYVNMTNLMGADGASTFKQQVQSARENSSSTIPPPSSDSSISEGYKAIYDVLTNTLFDQVSYAELVMALTSPGTVTIQVALQHPFSQGRLYVNSTDPFGPVVIDPQYYSHFAGIKLIRQLGAALGPALGQEMSPGPNITSDQDIETCGMLPRAQGGAVDSKLRVYGADGWIANQVEFAQDSSSTRRTVKVRREVILAGGPMGSPAILMHSGFGPRDVLENAGIQMIEELPGVGQHLQDHLTAGVVWQSNNETAGDIHASHSDFAQSPEFLSFINDAIAYVNMTNLMGADGASTFKQQVQSARENSSSTIPPPSSDSSISEGYKAIYDVLTNTLFDQVSYAELVMALTSPGTVTIQVALQHPFSQGRLYVNSTDPFGPVVIDPQYYSHFADIITMRQGIKLIRQLGAALGPALGQEMSPGPNITSDQDIETCGMLPRAQGGAVDSKLRVYGAANVRVADSSVFPFIVAAHLASPTYGLAEQAAVLIQQEPFTVPNSARTNIRPLTEVVSLVVGLLTAVLVFT
ncbi:Versicolorin B synthase [Leucoagaricus sp. SymC.cos]|nr:Versicolorin B synthase [Leucoagaricus sp. SymC.cos]